MAVNGVFTYYDLYGGKPENYHQQNDIQSSSVTPENLETGRNTTTLTSSSTVTTNLLNALSATSTPSTIKFHRFAQKVSFAYFYWLLIGLAILLTCILIIIFICFYRNHCKKRRKPKNGNKNHSLPHFYTYRAGNPRLHGYNIYEPSASIIDSSTSRLYPTKSVEKLNNQLLRQGLDAVGSPKNARIDVNRKETPNTFTNAASNLLTEIKGRLNSRSSDSSTKQHEPYETQNANILFNNERKTDDALLTIMN